MPDAIRAFDIARRRTSRAMRLSIVGRGPLESEARSLAERLGLGEAAAWLGFQPHQELLRRLQWTDTVLAPSATSADGDNEGGAPTILIEAQAARIPIVSTLHADIPEVVVDGQTGYLVREHDIEGLADRLVRLAEDRSHCRAFGQAAREHVRRSYNILNTMPALESVYDQICQEVRE